MKVGVFDHLDRNDRSLHAFYEERLKIVEAYDRGGFYAYHTAEHHATPLGLAASPSVFLAAVAQRTQRLRFGPLVYTLPLHHPLRVAEEICMLDQLSQGRFELGVGRGISPIETAYYGINPDHRQKMYLEALQILRQALTARTLTFHGEFYHYTDVPIELEPFHRSGQARAHPMEPRPRGAMASISSPMHSPRRYARSRTATAPCSRERTSPCSGWLAS
jgi:alkanesulfonate monooxygenase SsuD/methylene tetrahydromethanopterin reductase-like flavin-dependent oxidoreductase (luciferase family)